MAAFPRIQKLIRVVPVSSLGQPGFVFDMRMSLTFHFRMTPFTIRHYSYKANSFTLATYIDILRAGLSDKGYMRADKCYHPWHHCRPPRWLPTDVSCAIPRILLACAYMRIVPCLRARGHAHGGDGFAPHRGSS